MEQQPDYEPEQPRRAAVAPAVARENRPTPGVRPILKAIPGGNSDLNRLDKTRTARAG